MRSAVSTDGTAMLCRLQCRSSIIAKTGSSNDRAAASLNGQRHEPYRLACISRRKH